MVMADDLAKMSVESYGQGLANNRPIFTARRMQVNHSASPRSSAPICLAGKQPQDTRKLVFSEPILRA